MDDQGHFGSLDAVRGLAALAVAGPHFLLFRGHTSPTLEFVSVMAVEVFFVLSGVVLAPQLLRCVRSGSWQDVRTFYVRRWMRTIPPYAFALSAIAILTGNLTTIDFAAYALFVRNLLWIDSVNEFFTVAWSLAVEEWFYFVFPVFLVLSTRWLGIRDAGLLFLAIFLVVKLVWLVLSPESFAGGRRIVALRVDAICFGFLLALALPSLKRPSIILAALAVSLAASVYGFATGMTLLFVYAASIFAACLIVAATFCEPLFSSKPLADVAQFGACTSYMVYLTHTAVIILLGSLSASEPVLFAIYLIATYGFCLLFYFTVEAPILRARPKYRAAHP